MTSVEFSPTAMPLRRALRQATAAAHRSVEGSSPFLGRDLSLAGYVRWMAHMRPLWHALEGAVQAQGKALCACAIPWGGQMRLAQLDQDLHFLGSCAPEQTKPPASLVAALHRPEDMVWASGVLYVMGGSRIGGQLVAKRLKHQLKLTTFAGLSFWAQDNTSPEDSFARLMSAFARHIKTDVQQQRMIAAANATFAAWEQWFAPATTEP